VDENGQFCHNTNSGSSTCYITLGPGYNDAPCEFKLNYTQGANHSVFSDSLVPFKANANNVTARPPAMWLINANTGVLSATWDDKSGMQFTINENPN